VLEIILGIDNIVFISVIVSRCSPRDAMRARQIGLSLALIFRIILLLGLTWLMRLTYPVFTGLGRAFSWHDIILIVGGLFLLWKATTEIGEALEGEPAHAAQAGGQTTGRATMTSVLTQIVLLDIVFSLDTVLTAVGMADDIAIMVAAVVIAVGVMLVASGPLSKFVHAHPSVKMLALAFLLLIGVTLILEGFGVHVDKAYIYAAIAFSVFVEYLNLRARRNRANRVPVELHPTFVKDELEPG